MMMVVVLMVMVTTTMTLFSLPFSALLQFSPAGLGFKAFSSCQSRSAFLFRRATSPSSCPLPFVNLHLFVFLCRSVVWKEEADKTMTRIDLPFKTEAHCSFKNLGCCCVSSCFLLFPLDVNRFILQVQRTLPKRARSCELVSTHRSSDTRRPMSRNKDAWATWILFFSF